MSPAACVRGCLVRKHLYEWPLSCSIKAASSAYVRLVAIVGCASPVRGCTSTRGERADKHHGSCANQRPGCATVPAHELRDTTALRRASRGGSSVWSSCTGAQRRQKARSCTGTAQASFIRTAGGRGALTCSFAPKTSGFPASGIFRDTP